MWAPIHHAAFEGNFHKINAIVNATNIESARKAIIDSKLESGATPLHLAVQKGHAEAVSTLLRLGANANEQTYNGTTPLYLAAQHGYEITTKILVNDYKAEVDKPTENGTTPLYIACQEGYPNVVKFLIEKGASISKRPKSGATCLHIACQQGHLKCVEILVENGAEVNCTTERSRKTPLHMAVANAFYPIVRYLLKKGANSKAEMADGYTARSIAEVLKSVETLQILNEYESKSTDWLTTFFTDVKGIDKTTMNAYIEKIRENDIGEDIILEMDKDLLLTIGITNVSHIAIILEHLSKKART